MKQLFLFLTALFISCSNEQQTQQQSKADFNTTFNKINLDTELKENIVKDNTNKVSVWNDVINSRQWSQTTLSNQPIYDAGIIFDGSNDALVVSGDNIQLTDYSFYCVVQYLAPNTGTASNKALISAQSTRDWFGFGNNYNFTVNTNSATKRTAIAGYKGNRPVVIGVRKSGENFTFTINDRVCRQTGTSSVPYTLFGRIGGIGGLGGFNANMKVRAIYLTNTALNDTDSKQVVDSLYTKYNLQTETAPDNICGFGDSNTVGTGSVSYLVSLSARMNLAHLNLGISGTLFTNVTGQVNNGYDRIQSQLVTKPYSDYVVIMYGTNDISAHVTAEVFAGQLQTKISGLIAQGYKPERICLVTPPYQRDNQNETPLNQYAVKIFEVAQANGTRFVDFLGATRSIGNACLVSNTADKVHINQNTQDLLSDLVYNAFNP